MLTGQHSGSSNLIHHLCRGQRRGTVGLLTAHGETPGSCGKNVQRKLDPQSQKPPGSSSAAQPMTLKPPRCPIHPGDSCHGQTTEHGGRPMRIVFRDSFGWDTFTWKTLSIRAYQKAGVSASSSLGRSMTSRLQEHVLIKSWAHRTSSVV